jgi:hypothetical protein
MINESGNIQSNSCINIPPDKNGCMILYAIKVNNGVSLI